MAWQGVVTNQGAALLAQYATGEHTLTIDGATVGSGITEMANLRIATALAHQEDTASILSKDAITDGTVYNVQVHACTAGRYQAHEVGLWAHLDNGQSVLLALHQDADGGIDVPQASVNPNFSFLLRISIAISNDGTVTVNVDTTAFITNGYLEDRLGQVREEMDEELARKQGTLTFDSTPTSGSTNPVTSGGVYEKIGLVGNTPLQTQINTLNSARAYKIVTTSSDDTWASLYSRMSSLPTNETATIYFDPVPLSVITSGKYSAAGFGTVLKISSAHYRYQLQVGTSNQILIQQNSATSSNVGSITITEIAGPISALERGIGIRTNGDTHIAISAGEFVFVQNHDTLSTGLYTAKSNIAADAALSTSNLTAVPNGGGLNMLNSKLGNNLVKIGALGSVSSENKHMLIDFTDSSGNLYHLQIYFDPSFSKCMTLYAKDYSPIWSINR